MGTLCLAPTKYQTSEGKPVFRVNHVASHLCEKGGNPPRIQVPGTNLASRSQDGVLSPTLLTVLCTVMYSALNMLDEVCVLSSSEGVHKTMRLDKETVL